MLTVEKGPGKGLDQIVSSLFHLPATKDMGKQGKLVCKRNIRHENNKLG